MLNNGKVYLTGAGPGPIELLTVRAYELLKEADVVVYDRLVGNDILEILPRHCIRHYVGKKESDHTLPQNEINSLLVEYARRYKKVIRLKGGDPFVFGRGGEEVEVLIQHGIPFELVPGISSSVAAATYAGIPVTHRGVANNFTVIAGHTCSQNGVDTYDWKAFANLGTLVILMGVKNRQMIAAHLIKAGKSAQTPVAFIESATRDNQKTIITNLLELSINPPEVMSPAVMVIGEVVKFHHQWEWFQTMNYESKEEVVGL